jgi:hypothetical protein
MSEFAREAARFNTEVDVEAARLVREGVNPHDALVRARMSVERTRRDRARQTSTFLPTERVP